jgi:hypothetical protein
MDTPEELKLQLKNFTEELCKLCKQFNIIVEEDNVEIYKSGKKPSVVIKVNNFLHSYLKLSQEKNFLEKGARSFFKCFVTWGNLYRSELLQSVKVDNGRIILNDEWLRNNKIVIDMRDTLRGLNEDEKKLMAQRVLEVSTIYNMAMDLYIKNTELMEQGEAINDLNLKRRHIVLLHLIRIYYYLSDIATKKVLGVTINDLEDELGINKNKYEEDKPKSNGGLFSRILSSASKIIGPDINLADTLNCVNEDQLVDTFEKIVNNEETTQIVKNISERARQCKDFKSVVSVLAEEVTQEGKYDNFKNVLHNAASELTESFTGGSSSSSQTSEKSEVEVDF